MRHNTWRWVFSFHVTTKSVGSVLGELLFSFLCCWSAGVIHCLPHSGLLVWRHSSSTHWFLSSLFMHSSIMGLDRRGKSISRSWTISWQMHGWSIRANTAPEARKVDEESNVLVFCVAKQYLLTIVAQFKTSLFLSNIVQCNKFTISNKTSTEMALPSYLYLKSYESKHFWQEITLFIYFPKSDNWGSWSNCFILFFFLLKK